MLSKKSKVIMLIAVVVVLILAIKLIEDKKAAMKLIPEAKTYGVVVPFNTAVSAEVQITLPYLAEVESDSDVSIASKLDARVIYIANAGTVVKQGDLLVKVDGADLKARKNSLLAKIDQVSNEITAKQSELANLKRVHRDNKKLLAVKAVPQSQYDTETSQIKSLVATIASMKNNAESLYQNIEEIKDTLTYTLLKAPFDGVVSKAFVAEGGIASRGKTLLNLMGGTDKRFVTRTAQKIKPLALIYKNNTCILNNLNSTLNGLDEYSCPVTTSIPAGSREKVKLVIYKGEGILVPVDGLLNINNERLMLIVKDDHAYPVNVSIVAEGSEGYVVKGIKAGDKFVLAKADVLLKVLAGVRVIEFKK